jgi:hypothetical protein
MVFIKPSSSKVPGYQPSFSAASEISGFRCLEFSNGNGIKMILLFKSVKEVTYHRL